MDQEAYRTVLKHGVSDGYVDNSKKMNIQVEPNHYFDKSYDTKERFISYWHQVNEIVRLEPDSLLEIGIGSGFASKYLK
ncbi:MAG: hypothetical protein KAH35_01115 [Candidatus Atribacteria bacterium]|nr:hypothetical protein [Candidatus Atribacteria bacterium]